MTLLVALTKESYNTIEKINIRESLVYGLDSRTLENSVEPDMGWKPMQHPEIEDMVIDFIVKVYKKYALLRVEYPKLEVAVDNSCTSAIHSLNEKLYAKGLSHAIEFHKGTKNKIRERINVNKQAMGKGIVKIHPDLKMVLGAMESLK